MPEHRRLKRILYAGAAAGAALSVTVSLLMDTLYADSLGGTWRDAITKDLHTFFSMNVPQDSLIVTAVFGLILMVLAAFGAFLGYVFSFIIYRFFTLLAGR